MKIVIDISEEEYNEIEPFLKGEAIKSGFNLFKVLKTIKNGTPLPKGHGDLIDRGKLKTHFIGTEQGTDLEVYLEPTIINAPVLIEADKESEVK